VGVDPVSDSPSRAVIFERSNDAIVRLTEVQNRPSLIPVKTPYEGRFNTDGFIYYPDESFVFIEPKPFNIAAIRELGSGTKARKESMSMLHKFAVDRVSASNGIFIRGNVASSKNSKTMGFYYEGKGANKKRVPTLVDSPATKNYRKETAADYRKYKDRFLQMTEGKDFPLMVRMTLIRDSLRAFDLINAAQIVQDLMVEYGWIEDDNSEFLVPVFNPTVYYSKDMAGILIEVI
jgi:hypothetical protein